MIELIYNDMTLGELYQIHENVGTRFVIEDGKVTGVQNGQD